MYPLPMVGAADVPSGITFPDDPPPTRGTPLGGSSGTGLGHKNGSHSGTVSNLF